MISVLEHVSRGQRSEKLDPFPVRWLARVVLTPMISGKMRRMSTGIVSAVGDSWAGVMTAETAKSCRVARWENK